MNNYVSKFKKSAEVFKNLILKKDLYYIVEDAEWAIKHIGQDITDNLNRQGLRSRITLTSRGIYNSLVHFGSINVFMPEENKFYIPHKSNKVVVTYFHLVPDDKRIHGLPNAIKFVDMWHTPSSITKERLTFCGISSDKIKVIPLGIDLDRFKPLPLEERQKARKKMGIPEGKILVGSFQKDGVGWGRGLEPKFIKGPDIFCDVVEQLASKYQILVLLIGPSRGYIKKRLESNNIPYRHYPYIDYSQIHQYYQLLDLYLITSRIEGGPRALLECMATSTPFVTTRVGMAKDIMTDYEDSLVCDIDDKTEIIDKARQLIEDHKLKEKLCVNMRKTAQNYSWDNIIKRYYSEIYKSLSS